MARLQRRSCAVLIRQFFLRIINVIATVLRLFTGIKDIPVVVGLTGRDKFIRSRLQDGSVNYDMARMEAIKSAALHDLPDVGQSYSFFSTPDRSPATLGEDRSLCLRVNSMNATTYAVYYDDYWGNGPRRTIRYIYSISAPNCQNDQLIQVGLEKDFGQIGMPILKCFRRPERSFNFNMDLIVQHSYWAGNVFHFEFQTSVCQAKPMLITPDWKWTLLQIAPVDQSAKMAIGIAESGVVGQIVTPVYGIVSITMFSIGIYAAITRSRTVKYLPDKVRYADNRRLLRYVWPFMNVAISMTDQARAVITLKGSIITASNCWLNHWLYIFVNIVNAVVHLRLTYVKLNLGTWILNKKTTLEGFLFLCSAFTAMSWLICAAHTVLCFAAKLLVRIWSRLVCFLAQVGTKWSGTLTARQCSRAFESTTCSFACIT